MYSKTFPDWSLPSISCPCWSCVNPAHWFILNHCVDDLNRGWADRMSIRISSSAGRVSHAAKAQVAWKWRWVCADCEEKEILSKMEVRLCTKLSGTDSIKKGPSHAFCITCNRDLTISHGGKFDCERHVESPMHKSNSKASSAKISTFLGSAASNQTLLAVLLISTGFHFAVA